MKPNCEHMITDTEVYDDRVVEYPIGCELYLIYCSGCEHYTPVPERVLVDSDNNDDIPF